MVVVGMVVEEKTVLPAQQILEVVVAEVHIMVVLAHLEMEALVVQVL